MSASNRRRWLSESATALNGIGNASRHPKEVDCDVLIVGSGYGGAVAAARLSAMHLREPNSDGSTRPAKVFVLERGNEYLPGMFPATFGELPAHVRFSTDGSSAPRGVRTGLFDMRLGDDVNVIVGNGLGGGSLINAAVMERPTADAFDTGWPTGLTPASLETSYLRAESMLKLGAYGADGGPQKMRSLLRNAPMFGAAVARPARLAIAMGTDTTSADVPARACTGCGNCVAGCNAHAKHSLDVNYLAQARRQGARLFCGATVQAVRRTDVGWEVQWYLTDRGVDRSDALRHRLHCRYLILSAGVLGSAEILFRSRQAGLPVSGQLGRRFSTNGDSIAAAYAQREPAHCRAPEGPPTEPHSGIGPTIAAMARVPVPGHRPIVIQEFAIPAPLVRLLDEVVTTQSVIKSMMRPSFRMPWSRRASADPAALDEAKLQHTMVYGVIGDDGAGGRLVPATTAPNERNPLFDGQITIRWPEVRNAPVFQHQIEALRRAHDDGEAGGVVFANPLWQPLPERVALPAGRGPVTTVHPLGGCVMADGCEHGVVNRHGQVFDADLGGVLRGLAVLDGSIVPVALGINPALTIAALAEQAVPVLAKEWGLVTCDEAPSIGVPLPQRHDWSEPEPEPEPGPGAAPGAVQSRIRIRERSIGEWTGALRANAARPATARWPLQVSLELDFAEVCSLSAPIDVSGTLTLVDTANEALANAGSASSTAPAPEAIQRCFAVVGKAHLLVDDDTASVFTRLLRAWRLTRRRIQAFTGEPGLMSFGTEWMAFVLSTHVGGQRSMRYELTLSNLVPPPPAAAPQPGVRQPVWPLQAGDVLELDKTIEFTEDGNPWRQMSRSVASRRRGSTRTALGVLDLDLCELADARRALLEVVARRDQPAAIADLIGLALFTLRAVLPIHAPNLLWPREKLERRVERLPGAVIVEHAGVKRGVDPVIVELPTVDGKRLRLSRYRMSTKAKRIGNPVLLIHGFGASGTTFTHPSIEGNAVSVMLKAGMDVWVLDLRTSIGLEQRDRWSFENVARGDIVGALDHIVAVLRKELGQSPRASPAPSSTASSAEVPRIDIVAHCIGAAMFCMALLDVSSRLRKGAPLRDIVGAVVLSQVGPRMRLSPYNRFRGFLAAYLKQYLQVRTLDVLGHEHSISAMLLDAMLASAAVGDERSSARFRHRVDAIYGKLMNPARLSDATLKALPSLLGWVRIEMLAQVMYFARRGMITDEAGDNIWLSRARVARCFQRPVMLVHGVENAVFDWQGAIDSLNLLRDSTGAQAYRSPPTQVQWRTRPVDMSQPELDAWGLTRHGNGLGWIAGSVDGKDVGGVNGLPHCAYLVDGFGHQDSMIGSGVEGAVFKPIVDFLLRSAGYFDAVAPAAKVTPRLELDLPRIGPMLGRVSPAMGPMMPLAIQVLLEPRAEHRNLRGVLVVPFIAGKRLTRLGLLYPIRLSTLRSEGLRLELSAQWQHLGRYELLVLMLHDGWPANCPTQWPAWVTHFAPSDLADIDRQIDALSAKALRSAMVQVDRHRLDAADDDSNDDAASPPAMPVAQRLTFAVGSCQYPAALFDRPVAQASYHRLEQRLDQDGEHVVAPQFLLLLGDQVYVDEAAGLFDPADFGDQYVRPYELNLELDAIKAVARRLPTYPILDDHEVVDNWEPGRDPRGINVDLALQAYRRWQSPLVGKPCLGSDFSYPLRPAGYPLFVVDTRARRSGRSLAGMRPCPCSADMVERPTLRRLLKWLSDQPAEAPKFIASAAATLPLRHEALSGDPGELAALDDWGGYPATLATLLHYIAAERIQHVVLLAGDLHLSLLARLRLRPGGDKAPIEVLSIVASGLHSPWPFANTRRADLRLQGEFAVQMTHSLGDPDMALQGVITEAPAANAPPSIAACRGAHPDFRRQLGGVATKTLAVEVRTDHVVSGEGFAIVDVKRQTGAQGAPSGWRVSVEFDMAPGGCKTFQTVTATGLPWHR